MRRGDRVVAKRAVGGPVTEVPRGTRGVIVQARPMAGRYEVRFDNGRTETCRDRDLTVVRYAPRLHHGAAPRFVGAGVARPAP